MRERDSVTPRWERFYFLNSEIQFETIVRGVLFIVRNIAIDQKALAVGIAA